MNLFLTLLKYKNKNVICIYNYFFDFWEANSLIISSVLITSKTSLSVQKIIKLLNFLENWLLYTYLFFIQANLKNVLLAQQFAIANRCVIAYRKR